MFEHFQASTYKFDPVFISQEPNWFSFALGSCFFPSLRCMLGNYSAFKKIEISQSPVLPKYTCYDIYCKVDTKTVNHCNNWNMYFYNRKTADGLYSWRRALSYFILVNKIKEGKETCCLLCDQHMKNWNSTHKYRKNNYYTDTQWGTKSQ